MVADQFGLQLDTSIDSHQLIQAVWPDAVSGGRNGPPAWRWNSLAEPARSQRRTARALAGAIARVQDRLEQTGTALRKATAASPALASALAAPWRTAEQQTLAIMALARRAYRSGRHAGRASATCLERAAGTIDAQFAINGAASSPGGHADARIEALRMRLDDVWCHGRPDRGGGLFA
jgi:hypothetical protein